MSSRSSVNCSLIDCLSRMRMTASSPCALGMIETRKSMVLPRTRSRKRPSCGTRFSAMSSSAITLMREMIALCEPLGDRPHGRLQHAVDAVLHAHRVVLRLDVDVAGAALDGREDRRVDQPDDRAVVARQPLDGEVVFARVLVLEDLDLELLGGLVEHALRALALLEDRLDRRAARRPSPAPACRAAPPARRSSAGRSGRTRRSTSARPSRRNGTKP